MLSITLHVLCHFTCPYTFHMKEVCLLCTFPFFLDLKKTKKLYQKQHMYSIFYVYYYVGGGGLAAP